MVFDSLRPPQNGDRGVEATPGPETPTAERPTIGLALGGGAARGFAHIGVIRTLAKHGIKPDVIVGTSIGAVVGGCYAAGQLDAFEQWARGLTRRGILELSRRQPRGQRADRRRQDRGAARHCARRHADRESLPLRFATITTEVGTGHEIWLTRGRLVDALRASYALPGIFPPVRLGGRWLVDGALVNPVPVSAARALGARLVIAVNLNADMLGRGVTIPSHGSDENDQRYREELAKKPAGLRGLFGPERSLKRQFLGGAERPGLPTVMVDAFNIMQDRVTRARLAGDPPDVTISPRIGHIGWFDFHRAQEAIEIGARTTQRTLDLVDEAVAALAPRPAQSS